MTKRRSIETLRSSGSMEDQPINDLFNIDELKRALSRANKNRSSPGKDQVRSIMIRTGLRRKYYSRVI